MTRRSSARETRYYSTTVLANDIEYDCIMLDESSGGCRLRIDGETGFAVGMKVKVKLMSVDVPAIVRHVDANRFGCLIGVEFQIGGMRQALSESDCETEIGGASHLTS